MTNGDWIRTLDDAKANELFGGGYLVRIGGNQENS